MSMTNDMIHSGIAAALGVLQQKTLMDSAFRVVRNPTKRGGPRKVLLVHDNTYLAAQ